MVGVSSRSNDSAARSTLSHPFLGDVMTTSRAQWRRVMLAMARWCRSRSHLPVVVGEVQTYRAIGVHALLRFEFRYRPLI